MTDDDRLPSPRPLPDPLPAVCCGRKLPTRLAQWVHTRAHQTNHHKKGRRK